MSGLQIDYLYHPDSYIQLKFRKFWHTQDNSPCHCTFKKEYLKFQKRGAKTQFRYSSSGHWTVFCQANRPSYLVLYS
jgi:hypothetical protein